MPAVLTRVTAEQFEEEFDTRGLELLDGEVVEVEMGAEAAWVTANVFERVKPFTREHALGLTFQNDVGIACCPDRPDHVRKPDGMFFSRDRLSSVPRGWITAVPSLVWEVVSPHDRAPLLRGKLEDYRQAAIPVVWVFYPEWQVVDVWKPDGTAARLGPEDSLTAKDILPGFTVTVRDLFVVP